MIFPRFRRSKVKHIPLVILEGSEFYPWDPAVYSLILRAKKIEEIYRIKIFGSDLELDPEHFSYLGEKKLWEKFYCPVSVTGKTVLDAGAGCGETSAFYFQKGAKRIIAIESNPDSFKLLQRNIEKNNWDVVALNQRFDETMLEKYSPDFCKIDIEGGEECLLAKSSMPIPAIIEVHSVKLEKLFTEKLGMRVVDRPLGHASFMSNIS